MDKKAAEPLLVVRSSLYEGPTMMKPENGLAAMAAPEKPAVKRTAGLRKPLRPAASTQQKKKEPLVTAPPPPQRIIVVELIQGIKRTKDTFEESSSEPTENSTQPDGKKQ
jgi:hypothetical protein